MLLFWRILHENSYTQIPHIRICPLSMFEILWYLGSFPTSINSNLAYLCLQDSMKFWMDKQSTYKTSFTNVCPHYSHSNVDKSIKVMFINSEQIWSILFLHVPIHTVNKVEWRRENRTAHAHVVTLDRNLEKSVLFWNYVHKPPRSPLNAAVKPRSHLPRTPCDPNCVYDYFVLIPFGQTSQPNKFYGNTCSRCLPVHRAISSIRDIGGNPGWNPYRDCAEIALEIVLCQWSCRPDTEVSARKSYGASSQVSDFARCPRMDCAMPPTACLWATVLRFFQGLWNFSVNQVVQAAEPVNPYENLTCYLV